MFAFNLPSFVKTRGINIGKCWNVRRIQFKYRPFFWEKEIWKACISAAALHHDSLDQLLLLAGPDILQEAASPWLLSRLRTDSCGLLDQWVVCHILQRWECHLLCFFLLLLRSWVFDFQDSVGSRSWRVGSIVILSVRSRIVIKKISCFYLNP